MMPLKINWIKYFGGFLPIAIFPNVFLNHCLAIKLMSKIDSKEIETEKYTQKVVEAIQSFLQSQKFTFYNVNNFEDLAQLKQNVLVVLIERLQKETLKYEEEDLICNFANLSIEKFLNLSTENLKIQLKYLSKRFEVNIALTTQIDDDILSQAIKSFFDQNQFKNKDLLTFFQWEKAIDIFNEAKPWVKNIIKTQSFKINQQEVFPSLEKLDIFLIDLEPIKTSRQFFLTATFGNSQAFMIKVPVQKLLNEIDIANAIQTTIDASNIDFLIDVRESYKSFNLNFYDDLWKENIETYFAIKPLFIGNKKLIINKKNVFLNPNQKLTLTPWTKNFKVNCEYKIGSFSIPFTIPVGFKREIDYSEIKNSFIKNLDEYLIDANIFKKIYQNNLSLCLATEIKKIFNKKIIINKQKYDLMIEDLQVNNYYFFYKNGYGQIKINITSNSLYPHPFDVEIELKNYETFFTQKIFDFLKQFSKSNPFDVNNKINEDNTWNDVINQLTLTMQKSGIDGSILNHIHWQSFFGDGSSLSLKLKDDGTENTIDYKNVKLNIFGIEIPKYTLWIKNIMLSDSFKVDIVAKKFSLTQVTNRPSKWPNWLVNDKVTAIEIGIKMPPKIYDVDINYYINSTDVDSGIVIVDVVIKKNHEIKKIKVKLIQFTKSKDLINKITTYFENIYDAKDLSLSSQNTHYDAYQKIVPQINKIIAGNEKALREITIYNPDQMLKKAIQQDVEIVEMEITIGRITKIIKFRLKNIN